MSLYFRHRNLLNISDETFESVFKVHVDLNDNFMDKDPYRPIEVKLNTDSIDFFYQMIDQNAPSLLNRREHLFSIPLDLPNNTDIFLLKGNKAIKRNIYSNKTTQEFNKTNNKLFYINQYIDISPFQFSYEFNMESNEKEKEDSFMNRCTFIEFILCFFEDIENKRSDFHKYSPFVSGTVLKALSQSPVYQLIKTKFRFYKTLYYWNEAGSPIDGVIKGDLIASFNVFCHAITKDEFSRVVPIYFMGIGHWFKTPTQELEKLFDLSKSIIVINVRENFLEIKNYFLKKHCVLSAIEMDGRMKSWKICIALSSISFALVLSKWLLGKYNSIDIYFLVCGIISYSVSFFCLLDNHRTLIHNFLRLLTELVGVCWHFIKIIICKPQDGILILKYVFKNFQNKRKSISSGINKILIMPRILIAISSAWLVVFSSEDFFKNQFSIERPIEILALVAFASIILYFILTEMKKISKWSNINKRNKRVIVIFSFSFCTSVIIGLFLHYSLGSEIIENSSVISDHTYQLQMSKLNNQKTNYSTFSDNLSHYRDYCTSRILNSKNTNKKISDNEVIIAKSYNSMLNVQDDSFYNDIKKRRLTEKMLFWKDNTHTINYLNELSKIDTAQISCNRAISSMDEIKNFFSDYENLTSLFTYPLKPDIKCFIQNHIPNYGFFYDSKKIYGYQVSIPILKEFKIYTRLFVFQVFLVITLAIVGQLVLSGKAMTESLYF